MSAIEQQADDWEYWWDCIDGHEVKLHDGDVHCGFYKYRDFDKLFKPVAVWRDGSEIIMQVGTERVGANRAPEVFLGCTAITKEAYDELVEHQKAHSNPDDPIYGPTLEQGREELIARVEAILKTDLANPHRLADAIHTVGAIEKSLKDMQGDDLLPHQEGLDRVKATYKEGIAGATLAKSRLRAMAKKTMEESGLTQIKGDKGKAISFRVRKKAKITSLTRLLNFLLREHPSALQEAAQKFANSKIKDDDLPPGVEVEEERSVQ